MSPNYARSALAVLGAALGLAAATPEQAAAAAPCGSQKIEVLLPGGLGKTANGALCALGSIDYKIQTKWKMPDGTIKPKTTSALLLLPKPVFIDDDILPDATVTLTISGPNQFTMNVARLTGGTLPASVEAIVDDPTNGVIKRERINHGFDARSSTVPQNFTSKIGIPLIGGDPDSTKIELDVESKSPGANITLLGGLFDGAIDDRKDPIGGRATYAPVPKDVGIDLTLGDDTYELDLTTGAPTKLTADVEHVENGVETRAHAELDKLPEWVNVDYTSTGEHQLVADYKAASTVDKADIVYWKKEDGKKTNEAVVYAKGVPTGLHVTQTAADAGTVTTTGGPIEQVEVAMTDDQLRFGPTDNSYVHMWEDANGKSSLSARLRGLTSASFAGPDVVADSANANILPPDSETDPNTGPSPDIRIDGAFAPGLNQAFDFFQEDADRKVSGSVSDLPDVVSLTVNPETMTTGYKGSEKIGTLTATIDSKNGPLFATDDFSAKLADHAELKVTGFPSEARLDVQPAGDAFKLSTNTPIDEVDAFVTSGPADRLPQGKTGVLLRRLHESFTAHARVKGLSVLDVGTTPIKVTTKLAQQPFALDVSTQREQLDENDTAALTEDPKRFYGDVANLPAELTISETNQGWDYVASSPILSVDLHGRDLAPGADEMRHFDAALTLVPKKFSITDTEFSGFKTTGIEVHEQGMIGEVALQGWSKGDAPAPLTAAENALELDTGTSIDDPKLEVRVHAFSIQKALLKDSSPVDEHSFDIAFGAAPKPVRALVKAPNLRIDADLDEPPAWLNLKLKDSTETKISYEAEKEFEDLNIDLRTPKAEADVNLDDLPPKLSFCMTDHRFACSRRMPLTFNYGDTPVTIDELANLDVQLEGETKPLRMTGQFCLVPADPPGGSTFGSAEGCMEDWDTPRDQLLDGSRTLWLNDLSLRDTHFELEAGDTHQKDEDGVVLEDNLIRFGLHTEEPIKAHTIAFDDYKPDGSGGLDRTYVALVPEYLDENDGFFSIDGDDYWIAMDADGYFGPSNEHESGSITCTNQQVNAYSATWGVIDSDWFFPFC